MSKVWPFNKVKEVRKAENERKSVAQLTKEQRLIVEDLIEHNWTITEIATDQDLPVEAVSRCRDIWKRSPRSREVSSSDSSDLTSSTSLREAKEALEIAKLNDQKSELEHKSEMRGIEREIAKAKKEQALAELEEDIEYEPQYQPEPRDFENPDDMFKYFLMMKMFGNDANKGNFSQANTPPQGNTPPQQQTALKQSQMKAMPRNLEEAKKGIKEGIYTEEEVIQTAIGMGFTEKQARKFYNEAQK